MMSSYYMHSWGPGFMFGAGALMAVFGAILFLLILAIKGYALWKAATLGQKWWFIILLVVNTLGILDLIYIIFVVKAWPPRKPSVGSPSTSSSADSSTPPAQPRA